MDNTNIPITLSEIPPRRQSSGLSFLLRSRDQSNSEVLASSPVRSRNNSITSTQSNTSKTFSQTILDTWLNSTTTQRSFDYQQDTFPPWVSEQAPTGPTDDFFLHTSNVALGRIFEEEDELALSCPTLDKTAKDRSPQPNLNDGYSILASERLPEEEEEDDENRETAFKSATSTSFSPTVDPPANNIGDDDSQETVAYHADDSDSQDTASYNADSDSQETVPYNVDSDSQDTVPYNVDSDSQDTIPYNVNDATLDDLEVHERSEEAHDPLDDLQAHYFSSDDLQVPLLVDINYNTRPSDSESNALPRDDDQHGSFSVSSIPFIEQVPFVTSPARMSSQSSRRISDPNVSLLPRILSPSSHHLDNNPNGSLLPRISSYQPPANEPLPSNLYNNNTLEEEQDELDDPFDDITEEDMLELVRMETTVTSQSSTSSKKRASSPIPNLSSSLQKKQLKSSLGTPIDNYFFHSSSSLNSTKDLEQDIGKSTLTPSFAISSSPEKAKPKQKDTRRRPRLGLSRMGSK